MTSGPFFLVLDGPVQMVLEVEVPGELVHFRVLHTFVGGLEELGGYLDPELWASLQVKVEGLFPEVLVDWRRLYQRAHQIAHALPKHFVALRGATQRDGDRKTAYARLENLGRVRVVVSPKSETEG